MEFCRLVCFEHCSSSYLQACIFSRRASNCIYRALCLHGYNYSIIRFIFLLYIDSMYCKAIRPGDASKRFSVYGIYMGHNVRNGTFEHVRQAKNKISLRIRRVWSDSSLPTWKNLGSLTIQKAHSEDSDQTARMRRLIWVFTRYTYLKVPFLMLRFLSRLAPVSSD